MIMETILFWSFELFLLPFINETKFYIISQEHDCSQQRAPKCRSWLAVGGYDPPTFMPKGHDLIRLTTTGLCVAIVTAIFGHAALMFWFRIYEKT